MFNTEKVGSTIIKIVGGLSILLTLILFFMITSQRSGSHWMGLLFLLIAQVMFFFAGPIIVQKKPNYNGTLLSSGTATILALYVSVALVLSLLSGVFVNIFIFYMVLQLTFLFVAVILALLLYAFSHKVNKDIEQTLVDREKRDWEAKRGKF